MLSLLPLPNELVVAVVAVALKIRIVDVDFEAVLPSTSKYPVGCCNGVKLSL